MIGDHDYGFTHGRSVAYNRVMTRNSAIEIKDGLQHTVQKHIPHFDKKCFWKH